MPDEAKHAFKRPSRAPRRMINKGADGQARCILITHKDERRYDGNIRSGGERFASWFGLCPLKCEHPPSARLERHTDTEDTLTTIGFNQHKNVKDAKGAFWGSVLARLAGVDRWGWEKKKSAHQVAFCNTHKASALMTFHASELGSENKSY